MGRKIALTGVLAKPSTRLSSHNAGNTFYVKSRLEDKFGAEVDIVDLEEAEGYDTLVLTEGVNFREGVYNLFGGVSEQLRNRLIKLLSFKGKVYSFGPERIDYSQLIEKRIPDLSLHGHPEVEQILDDESEKGLILGDSHSLSVYEAGYMLSRNDGKTLYGFLKEGIGSYIPEGGVKNLRFYAGNIDVRHHVCRQPSSIDAVSSLANSLYCAIMDLYLSGMVEEVELVELLPIENESRAIPQTGFFKGEPYFGSWGERNSAREAFNSTLKFLCRSTPFKVLEWPDLTNSLGELDFKYMESRQSVHLSPKYYMYGSTFIK